MLGCCSFAPLDALITEEDSGFSVSSSCPHSLIFSLLIINTSGLRIYLEFSLNDFFSWAQDCGWDGEQVMWSPDPCVFLSCSSLYLMRHGRLIEPRAPWWARLQLALEMPCLCLLSGKSQAAAMPHWLLCGFWESGFQSCTTWQGLYSLSPLPSPVSTLLRLALEFKS